MRRTLLAGLCLAMAAAGPAFPQGSETPPYQPIPVPQDAPRGSSGPSAASMDIGSGALILVGAVVVLAAAAAAIAASNH